MSRYSTCESEASFVAQVILAPAEVIEELATELITGGVVSVGVLLTVTVTKELVPMFPAASYTLARSVCEPLMLIVVSQENP